MRSSTGRSFVVLALGLALGGVIGSPLRAQDTIPAPPTLPVPAPVRPTLGTILDTATLRAGLRDVTPFEDERRLARLIRVSWDTSGAPQRPAVMVHGWAPDAWGDSVTALVRGALRPIAPSALRTTRYLLIETGPAARVEETHPEVTYARVANLGPLNRALDRAASDIVGDDDGLVGRTLPVRLTMTISEEGAVRDVRVVLSSGRADVDSVAMRLVSATRFVPQRVDGEVTPSRVTLPLRFVFPE